MDIAVSSLELALGGSFVLLAAACYRSGRRAPGRGLGLAALGFACVGIVLVLSGLGPITDYRHEWLGSVQLVAFLASGYLMLSFRHELLPLSPKARGIGLAAVVTTGVVTVSMDLPYGRSIDLTGTEYGAVVLLGLVWSACVGEPAVRFWRESRTRPAVQRARLRILSTGYMGLIGVALAWTIGGQTTRPALMAALSTVGLGLVPVLWMSFAPPRWLRRIWRDREETTLAGTKDLVGFHRDLAALNENVVRWACRLLGTDVAVLLGAGGNVLASRGCNDDPRTSTGTDLSSVVSVPVPSEEGAGELVVVAGPFTPVFGSDEIERLRAFASMAGVAMDRVRLVMALDRQNQRYERLLHAVSDLGEGVVVTDAGRLVYANAAYATMTGYTLDELRAMPTLLELSDPAERDEIAERLRQRLAGGSVEDHYEAGLIHKDGHRVEIEAAVKLMPMDEGPRIVSVIRDVTERKEHERKAAELDKIRGEFISNAAHELRTPLTAIVGLAATLAKHKHRMPEEDVDACTEGLDRGAGRLALLVNRLLDFTQIETGRLRIDLEDVNVAAIVDEVLASNPPPGGKVVRVDVARDISALADRLRLDQIVTNLLSNAYRYGGKNVAIHARRNGDTLLIDVDDDGPGIAQPLVDRLFDPFVRGSNEQEGAGLGLAIVRRVAEAFGGNISYQALAPNGSRFRVRLPLRSADLPRLARSAQETALAREAIAQTEARPSQRS